MRHGGLLALLILAVPEVVFAQAKVPLGKPDAESSEPFTNISSIRELASGKVLVADRVDKVVQLIDLAGGATVKVGREGKGPGEYSLPIGLIPRPDGSTLLQDPLNRRFLTIGADGKIGGTAELPPAPSSGPGGGLMLSVQGMQSDSRGRLYFQGPPFNFQSGKQLDSISVIRWEPGSTKLDTVGYFKPPASSSQVSGGGGNFQVRLGGQKVFTPSETWAVAGDGRIARLIPSPYRVVWYDGSGRSTAGPVLPYVPIKVGEAEKEQVREARRKNRPMTITMGPGGAASSAPPPSVQIPEPEFEETMPPFGNAGVLATPEGEVWVLRNRPASDKVPTYDVFDKAGALVKKISLAQNSRVVGFGKGTVYVARSDEDDLQYLQRFKRP